MRTSFWPAPLRVSVQIVAAVMFGLLAAIPQPGIITALLVASVGVAIGFGRGGLATGVGGLAVLVCVSITRALWLDGTSQFVAAELPSALLRSGLPWLISIAARQYMELGRRAEAARESLRRQHIAELETQVAADRLTLARSIHDDLGHSLSLIALSLARLQLAQDLSHETRQTVGIAREDLSQAIAHLGDSVSALRGGEPAKYAESRSPEEVLRRARLAGADLHVEGRFTPQVLVRTDSALVSRFLMETLTNATVHAPLSTIHVHAAVIGDDFHVRVTNKLSFADSMLQTAGTGLAVLKGEIEKRGGRFSTDSAGKNFAVSAHFPLTGQGHAAITTVAHQSIPLDEHRVTRITKRRQRLTMAATVAIVAAGLVAVEVSSMQHRQDALLAPEIFNTLKVGDSQEDTLALLPEQELPAQRGGTQDNHCHDYAVTTNPFTQNASNVYRICFTEGRISNLDTLAGSER